MTLGFRLLDQLGVNWYGFQSSMRSLPRLTCPRPGQPDVVHMKSTPGHRRAVSEPTISEAAPSPRWGPIDFAMSRITSVSGCSGSGAQIRTPCRALSR